MIHELHETHEMNRAPFFESLFEPVGDAAAGEIVRRHFHADAIANKNADTVLSHLAGHCRQHNVVGVIQLNFEEGVGLFVDDSALRWNQIVSGQ